MIEHLKLLDVCILRLLVIKQNIYSKISTNGGSSSYGAWPVMRSQFWPIDNAKDESKSTKGSRAFWCFTNGLPDNVWGSDTLF